MPFPNLHFAEAKNMALIMIVDVADMLLRRRLAESSVSSPECGAGTGRGSVYMTDNSSPDDGECTTSYSVRNLQRKKILT